MIAAYALAGTAVLLLVATTVTARSPDAPVPDLDGYLTRWSSLHHGYEPRSSVWARGLLTGAFVVAQPLARRGVRPDALTLWSVWLAAVALAAAQAGGRWPLLAGALVLLSGFGDALDGAVAALSGRATRWGYVLDSLSDRASEILYLCAVWAVGAPAWLAVACGSAIGLLEYTRARAVNAGMDEIGVVTVAERPVRVLMCAAALALAGALTGQAALAATVVLAALAALSAAGLLQLGFVAHRKLAGQPSGGDRA